MEADEAEGEGEGEGRKRCKCTSEARPKKQARWIVSDLDTMHRNLEREVTSNLLQASRQHRVSKDKKIEHGYTNSDDSKPPVQLIGDGSSEEGTKRGLSLYVPDVQRVRGRTADIGGGHEAMLLILAVLNVIQQRLAARLRC